MVPFLAILSVIGIKNIVEWTGKKSSRLRRAGLIVISAVTVIFIAFNFLYRKNYFNEIGPVKYILNQETKDEFLSKAILQCSISTKTFRMMSRFS